LDEAFGVKPYVVMNFNVKNFLISSARKFIEYAPISLIFIYGPIRCAALIYKVGIV